MENPKPTIGPTLTFREVYPDGRVTCLLVFEDGSWKIEVFPTEPHARSFAREHNMEVTNSVQDPNQERQ
jgi:hypothetical protein